MGKRLLLALLGCPFFFAETSRSSPILIYGWPVQNINLKEPPSWLSTDPLVGRMICPTLTRYNPSSGLIDSILVQRIETTEVGPDFVWKIYLKTGLYWWSGKPVTGTDLKDFLVQNMKKLVEDKGSSLWNLPSFTATAQDLLVEVHWQTKPEFGPYIINSAVLWRSLVKPSENSYECAGIYRPQVQKDLLILKLSPGHKLKAPDLHFILQGSKPLPQDKSPQLIFSFPEQEDAADPSPCATRIKLPWISLIAWNLNKPNLSPELRGLLTQASPRGALLRQGAAGMGELSSSPIPKEHPGYDHSIKLRPFDLNHVGKKLVALGFSQRNHSGFKASQAPLILKLGFNSPEEPLALKVISDSFRLLGIQVSKGHAETLSLELDGLFTGAELPWPEMNLLSYFTRQGLFEALKKDHKELFQALTRHALSVTHGPLHAQDLQRIHRLVYAWEPFTILLRHHCCLSMRSIRSHSIDFDHPDWFKKLVLQKDAT